MCQSSSWPQQSRSNNTTVCSEHRWTGTGTERKPDGLTWTFPDIKLKTASQFVKGIKLKHLNAADIPKNDSSVALGDNAFQPLNRVNVASWKVKFASAEGIPINFFANPLLSLKKSTDSQTKDQFSSDRSIKISMFTGVDDETLTKKTDLKQITLNATVRPFTKTIYPECGSCLSF